MFVVAQKFQCKLRMRLSRLTSYCFYSRYQCNTLESVAMDITEQSAIAALSLFSQMPRLQVSTYLQYIDAVECRSPVQERRTATGIVQSISTTWSIIESNISLGI